MKEHILAYLREAGQSVAPDQILRDVLSIRLPSAHSANKVLAGILGDDPRFIFWDGLWNLSPISQEQTAFNFEQAVILHLQGANRSDTPQIIRGAIRMADGSLEELFTPVPAATLSRLCSKTEGRLLIVWSGRELQLWNRLWRLQAVEAWRGDALYLRNFAARVMKRTPFGLQPEDLAPELGIGPPDEERPRSAAQYLSTCWLLLLDRAPAESRRDLKSLREWIEGPAKRVDFSRFAFGPEFLQQLPEAPGVYIMKNRAGGILYVGKSRNLRRRVSSYFTPRALGDPKTARIHEHLHSIDAFTTGNEIEALLTEMRLIKDFRPPINLQTEIREQQGGYDRPGRNLLLFVVDAERDGVHIYFLRDGIFAGRLSALLGRPASKRLGAKVQSFFTQGRNRKKRGEAWEKEIVSRWFAANRRHLNYLDIDQAGTFDSVMKLLHDYLFDPDKLAHKVYYR